MTDYRQCLACGADFEPHDPPGRGPRQVYCKNRRCLRDRDMEAKGRYYARLDSRSRKEFMGAEGATMISTGHCLGGRRRKPREEI